MISDRTLNEIKDRLNIVDLVAEYVTLKKSGTSFSGLCPFHKEKTPSFYVHPLKQCFHCFGCQKGGNVFTFLSAIEGLPFPEAVRKLAEQAGVQIEEDKRQRRYASAPKQKSAKESRLHEALAWAAKYYHYLLTEVSAYQPALDYLKSRHLSDETIKKFQLGVSPKGWHTLRDLMLKRGFNKNELVESGLLVDPDNGRGGYDRFRERLMFPIHDPEGNLIGFGARILKQEANQPKYINSTESPLFSKRKQLYGIYQNQRDIRRSGETLLVEGYMDVIGLYQNGVRNAVATMGTALTQEHCYLLKKLAGRVITVFDPDSAGSEAWHRSVDLFVSMGIFAKDLSLPEGKDPDEYVQEVGEETFKKQCEKAPRQITKLLQEIASKGPLNEESRAKILSDLTPLLVASRKLPDRALLWDSLSLVLNVSMNALKELSEPRYQNRKPADRSPVQIRTRPVTHKKALDPLSAQFFEAALSCPEAFFDAPKELWKDVLASAEVLKWLEALWEIKELDAFKRKCSELLQIEANPQISSLATKIIVSDSAPGKAKQREAQFTSLLERLAAKKKELEIKALSAQVRLSQKQGDEQAPIELLERLKALRSHSETDPK